MSTPILFIAEDAEQYGLNEAIILNQIRNFVKWAKHNNRNQHHGRHWTYNSMKAWSEQLGFLSEKQCRTAIESLFCAGIILKAKPNSSKWDHRTWVTLNNDDSKSNLPKEFNDVTDNKIAYDGNNDQILHSPSGASHDSSLRANALDTEGESSIYPNNLSINPLTRKTKDSENLIINNAGFMNTLEKFRQYFTEVCPYYRRLKAPGAIKRCWVHYESIDNFKLAYTALFDSYCDNNPHDEMWPEDKKEQWMIECHLFIENSIMKEIRND